MCSRVYCLLFGTGKDFLRPVSLVAKMKMVLRIMSILVVLDNISLPLPYLRRCLCHNSRYSDAGYIVYLLLSVTIYDILP